ncbi:FadR family transcriptional regulator [Arthrobacter sp. Sa2BUA2]|uniref:FadR family transcriptional regulator n=1 Tax=Arthrobacter pullicola TaxID=2762224 RepID=A0ABR8YM41_9MICC|nr:FCD domain-containing protein [Arthrobacter pullicola]MBD8045288.1 FadR family transcriptional regulator [Arthrobacter pullicola]
MASLEDHQVRMVRLLRDLGVQPGDPLPTEPQLALKLNMSRQSVREVLCALQALGFVEARQGARRRMRGFDPAVFGQHIGMTLPYDHDSLLEILEMRQALETQFFPAAFQTMSARRLKQLRGLTDAMRARAEEGKTFLDEDEQFHAMLYEGLENRTLSGILSGFWHFFKTASSTITTGKDLPHTAALHAVIVDAIETGDPQLAAHRLDIHFFDVRNRLAHLAEQDIKASPR